MTYLSPKEFLERYAAGGTAKTQKSAGKLLALAVLAGALIALGCAATNTAVHGMENVGLARTVSGLLFPFGLCMVIVTGAELFTGNSLLVLSLLEKKCTLPGLLRNWCLVYLGNFLGAVLVAAGCVWFGQLNYSAGGLAVYTIRLAAGLLAVQNPQYLQLARQAGVDLSALTVGNFLLGNLLPVTLGNVLGGAGLGVLLWYAHLKKG